MTAATTPASYDLLCIGNAIVDVIATCPEELITNEKMIKGDMQLIDSERALHLYDLMRGTVETSGGSAANTAAGFAKLGGSVAFVGKVQDDPLGQVYIDDISNVGVFYPCAKSDRGAPTGRSMIFVTPDGERTMNTFLGAAVELTPDELPGDVIAKSAISYLEGYLFDSPTARQACIETAEKAKAAGRKTALSLSAFFIAATHRYDFLGMMSEGLVDYVFANAEEARIFAKTDSLDAALDFLTARVPCAIVTTGPQGSVTAEGDQRIVAPATPIEKRVDATGAGDAFAAGYLYGLSQGESHENCARRGSDLAAQVIQQMGPRLA